MASSFHPPVRPPPKPPVDKTWYEELMERDEFLLYLTATLGVLMPGIVYIIYHKIHGLYLVYAKKKEEQLRKEKAEKTEVFRNEKQLPRELFQVAIALLGKKKSMSDTYMKRIASVLNEELANGPIMLKGSDLVPNFFMDFKGILLFFVETINGLAEDDVETLLEWLDDVAASKKQQKKYHFGEMRFAILGCGSSDKEIHLHKAAKVLLKRLKILGCKSICSMQLIEADVQEKVRDANFLVWTDDVLSGIEKELRGLESDFEDIMTDEESILSDEEDEDDNKKDR